MTDYRAPVNDALFTLRHIGMLDELAKTERFAHVDAETVATVLEEQGRFMQEVFGPTNAVGDREGLKWSPDGVTTPAVFKDAYAKFVEAGWQGLNAHVEYGGAGFPEAVFTAAAEFMTAANGALTMCPGLTSAAIEALQVWGTEEQKETYLRKLVTGEWTGTMNLTEPQAGSDVGLSTTKAEPQPDGTYKITGTKIFISFGEHDLADNIIHLVLARLPDAPAGTKGISLFIVPKFLVNDDGSLGARNDVRCVSIEHKMGIHASPTCVLSYGDEGGATGFLVGNENEGMRAMFTMMNSARLAVAVQGVAISDAAYQKALAYAQERVQGAEIGGASKEAVAIIRHPDVRRMLLFMRSHIEACRALVMFNAAALDLSRALDGDDAERWREVCELLTPVSKAWCTDVGVEVTSTAVQVFGGMGYIEESGVAQHFRDMRIAPIYEGTNGIQAMDLVGRKLPLRMGGVFADFIARMRATDAELAAAGDDFVTMRANLSAAIDELEGCANWIMSNGLSDPNQALAGATPFLRMFGIVVGGWLMARQALAAHAELAAGSDQEGYLRAKITTARYYTEQHLPQAGGLVAAVQAVAGEHHAALGVLYAVGDALGAEAGEDHRVDGADARAGQHGDGELGDHGHVDADAVALLGAVALEHVGVLAHLFVQLAVGVADEAFAGIVRLPDQRELVAALFQVAVQAVLCDVELAADEPLHLGLVEVPLQHLVPLLAPGKGFGLCGPESFGVLDAEAVGLVVFSTAPQPAERRVLVNRGLHVQSVIH